MHIRFPMIREQSYSFFFFFFNILLSFFFLFLFQFLFLFSNNKQTNKQTNQHQSLENKKRKEKRREEREQRAAFENPSDVWGQGSENHTRLQNQYQKEYPNGDKMPTIQFVIFFSLFGKPGLLWGVAEVL